MPPEPTDDAHATARATMPDVAVHPATGEVLEQLDQQPPELLAEALAAVHNRQAEAKRWADALEAELRRRLKLRQTKRAVFGDWEIDASTRRASVWDPDDLEPVLARLVDDGVVAAADITDVITRPPVVFASKANAVLRRLTGDAKATVEACRGWQEKPGQLTVTRSVALPAPQNAPPDALAARVAPSAPQSDLDPRELFA